jgi:uncharacterized protein YfiM (DUF2279 family)
MRSRYRAGAAAGNATGKSHRRRDRGHVMLGHMNKSVVAAAATLAFLVAAPAAHAESRSWAAVKRTITPGAEIVVSVDLVQLRKTAAYRVAMQQVLAKQADVKGGLDLVKATCGIDVPMAITDITAVVGKIRGHQAPLIVLGLDGVDDAGLQRCLQQVAAKKGNPSAKITATRKGKVTSYTLTGEDKQLHLAWLAPGVLAFTDDPNDRGRLDKVLVGKAPRGELAKMVNGLSTSAAVWFAVLRREQVPEAGTMRGVTGALSVVAGTFEVSTRVVMSKPAEASALLTVANAGVAQLGPELSKQAPELAKLLGAVRLAAVGASLEAAVSVSEKQLEALAPMLSDAL